MSYTTINKCENNFSCNLYTGNGGTQSITSLDFEPTLVWFKRRDGTDTHTLFDSVRGVTKRLITSDKSAEGTQSNGLTHFLSNGFTVGDAGICNSNNGSYVSWAWKGGTAVSGNTTGAGTYKTYTGSVNAAAGFSAIRFTGNGTSGHTIPHHLNAIPQMIIVRQLGGDDWKVFSSSLTNAQSIKLDESGSYDNDTPSWNSTSPTNSVFTVGNSSATNKVDNNYIAYSFAQKIGYSHINKYVGTGNANGKFIFTGHKPLFILVKNLTNSSNWRIFDGKRIGYNEDNNPLYPNVTNAEGTENNIDIYSNGFKWRTTDGALNASGVTYMYASFGQTIVDSNNTPCTAR